MPREPVDVPLAELTEALDLIKDDLVYRWMRRAQKVAINGWKNSATAPGVAARFLPEGKAFYHFSDRMRKYRYSKGNLPDYVRSGSLKAALLARSPHSENTGGTEVVTRFSIYGGALNALSRLHGAIRFEKEKKHITAHRRSYDVVRKGRSVHVSAYDQRATVVVYERTPAPKSYADEFGITPADQSDIIRRVDEEFIKIYRKAAFNNRGDVKRSALEKYHDAQEREAA